MSDISLKKEINAIISQQRRDISSHQLLQLSIVSEICKLELINFVWMAIQHNINSWEKCD